MTQYPYSFKDAFRGGTWTYISEGVGYHTDNNGKIDMLLNCPYVPDVFKTKEEVEAFVDDMIESDKNESP